MRRREYYTTHYARVGGTDKQWTADAIVIALILFLKTIEFAKVGWCVTNAFLGLAKPRENVWIQLMEKLLIVYMYSEKPSHRIVRSVNFFCNDRNDGSDGNARSDHMEINLFGFLACFVLFALYMINRVEVPFPS